VDNTLLDNDRFRGGSWRSPGTGIRTFRAHTLLGNLRPIAPAARLRDYLASLQESEPGSTDHPDLLEMSEFLLEYPFVARLFPRTLEAIAHVSAFGRPAILSDGDIVFQPRKIQRSDCGCGRRRVMIYLHRNACSITCRTYPQNH